jgi:hypothetical protein
MIRKIAHLGFENGRQARERHNPVGQQRAVLDKSCAEAFLPAKPRRKINA